MKKRQANSEYVSEIGDLLLDRVSYVLLVLL